MTPHLSCATCRALLPEYVAQTLTPPLTQQVAAHLATCVACRAELVVVQEVATLLHQPFAGETPPPDALARILIQLRPHLVALPPSERANTLRPPVAPPLFAHHVRAHPARRRAVSGIGALVIVALLSLSAVFVFTRPHAPATNGMLAPSVSTAELHDMLLAGVSFGAADDGWAVGSTIPDSHYVDALATPGTHPDHPYASPVLLHYRAGRWYRVEPPASLSRQNFILTAIQMLSPTDGWAIARQSYPPTVDVYATASELLRYHAGQWTVASQTFLTPLRQLALVDATHGWAVGDTDATGKGALLLRYDGTSWLPITDPALTGVALTSVAATGANDVWAAGIQTGGGGPDAAAASVFVHFDGHRWTQATLPAVVQTARITALALPSSADGWAVGVLHGPVSPSGAGTTNQPDQAILLRLRGERWIEAGWYAAPPGVAPFGWSALAFSTPTDGWVVGSAGAMVHLTGTDPLPAPVFAQALDLTGVALSSPNVGWAVGSLGTILQLQQGTWQPYQP